jgi:hypothetical protein
LHNFHFSGPLYRNIAGATSQKRQKGSQSRPISAISHISSSLPIEKHLGSALHRVSCCYHHWRSEITNISFDPKVDMSENWALAVNTTPNLRLRLEQMLNPYTSESVYASSPPESVADSTGGDGLVQFEGDQCENGLLGEENDESDGEADPNWSVQMTGIENDAQEDQRSQAQTSSDVPEDPRVLALRACAKWVLDHNYICSFG